MIHISFYLKTPNEPKSVVRVSVTNNGGVYRAGVGLTVSTKQWAKTKKGGWATNAEASARLHKVMSFLEGRLTDLSSPEEIKAALKALSEAPKAPSGNPTFWEYFDKWGARECATKRQRQSTVKRVGELMGRSGDWDDIDTAWYARLMQKLTDMGYSLNYRGIISSRLKNVMNEGFRMKYHTNMDYLQFHRHSETPETVYLTQAEVDRLWELQLDDESERKARDLFVLQVYTCTRFSDAIRLNERMISGGLLRFSQHKTGGSVALPVSPRVSEVFRRYGGSAPSLCQQNYNKALKIACMRARINETVSCSKTLGTARKTEIMPKWKAVSSHTGRRTGITLLSLNGVPLPQLRLVSGHSTESQLVKYLKLTKEQNAAMLRDNSFFR